MHLSSLLDLATNVHGVTALEVLNATVLSVMGRLRVMRACVLRKQSGSWVAEPSLCKGVAPVVLSTLEIDGITHIQAEDEALQILYSRGIERLVPLVGTAGSDTVIALGAMFDSQQDDDGVRNYLELVRMIAGAAVSNATMVDSLRVATKQLEARNLLVTSLFESARDFTAAISRDELLRMMSYRLMGQLMVNSFAMFLEKPIDGNEVIVVRSQEQSLESLHPSILTITEPCIVADLPLEHPLLDTLEKARIAMIAPMTLHGRQYGVIATRPKLNTLPFSADELHFLESLANTAIAAIENSRLLEEEIEKQRLESELEIAANIQQGLLPIELPGVIGLTMAAEMKSSRQVGGDYYDVIVLDSSRTMFAIADVAGKGVPAALLMANVQAATNVLARLNLPLPEIVARVNALVFENTDPEVFISLFLGIINTERRTLQYVNAGHNPPILVSERNSQQLTDGGLLIGIMAAPPHYEIGECELASGDVLVMYTDGVTEVRSGMEEFGVERLTATITSNRERSATEILHAIRRATQHFSGTDISLDDTSTVVVTVL